MSTEVDANLIIGMIIILVITSSFILGFFWLVDYENRDTFFEDFKMMLTYKKPKDEPSTTI